MVVECWAIIAVISLVAFTFFRRRKMDFGIAVLPLLLVPLVHLVGGPLSVMLGGMGLPWDPRFIRTAIDVIGLMVACFLFGGLSRNIKGKKARRGYIMLCGSFTVILTLVLLHDLAWAGAGI